MKGWASCTVAALSVLLGCSDSDPELLAAVDARPHAISASAYRPRTPLRTLPWVSDFRLGAGLNENGRVTQLQDRFSAGEPVYLSMQVNDVPRGTVVTTYWYGPNNLTLGYQTRSVSVGHARIRFVQSETSGWQQGAYRVEVWIGDNKIKGKYFDIVKR